MRTAHDASRTPIVAEAGLSWTLIAEGAALTNKELKPYSILRITALAADVKVTIDDVDALIIKNSGETVIINTGLGDPKNKRSVKVTTSGSVNCSAAEDARRDVDPQAVE